jgi:hypothetical protein
MYSVIDIRLCRDEVGRLDAGSHVPHLPRLAVASHSLSGHVDFLFWSHSVDKDKKINDVTIATFF